MKNNLQKYKLLHEIVYKRTYAAVDVDDNY